MKARLCLHGVDVKHQAQLLGLVKKELAGYSVSYKVKEHYFENNDMYKCRVAHFKPKGEQVSLHILCMWGVLLVSDKPINMSLVPCPKQELVTWLKAFCRASCILCWMNRIWLGALPS